MAALIFIFCAFQYLNRRGVNSNSFKYSPVKISENELEEFQGPRNIQGNENIEENELIESAPKLNASTKVSSKDSCSLKMKNIKNVMLKND